MASRLQEDSGPQEEREPVVQADGISDLLKPQTKALNPTALVTLLPGPLTSGPTPVLTTHRPPLWSAERAVRHTPRPTPPPIPADARGTHHPANHRHNRPKSKLEPTADKTSANQDRRRERRIPFEEDVEIWQRDDEGRADRFSAWGLNISQGGLRIIYNGVLETGERIGVQLRNDRQALPARVAWVKPQHDGCIAGLTFAA